MINFNGTGPQALTNLYTAPATAVYALHVSLSVTETPPARTVHLKVYRNGGAVPSSPGDETFPSAPAPAVVAADGRGAAFRTIHLVLPAGATLEFSVERYAGSGSTTVPPWSVDFRLERLGDEL